MSEYRKPASAAGALRLHLNENTAGCSPRVLAAIRAVGARDAAFYPEYDAAYSAAARYYGVGRESLVLTNGLDEGILAATAAAFRSREGGVPEALTVTPTFDMYDICVEALGGRMRTISFDDTFVLDPGRVASAVTPATRIVFITTPHNPSGVAVPAARVLGLARAIAPTILFVDEAYAEFGGTSVATATALSEARNVIVGRTFAKAFGLAGLRAGALLAGPETLEAARRVVLPYTLNAVTAAALPAAIGDTEYRDRYIGEARRSRGMIAAACSQLGLRTWPSEANFVLVDAGPRASALAAGLAARGIIVRDKSREAGTEGCLRMTAGWVADTARLVAALEEASCDAQR